MLVVVDLETVGGRLAIIAFSRSVCSGDMPGILKLVSLVLVSNSMGIPSGWLPLVRAIPTASNFFARLRVKAAYCAAPGAWEEKQPLALNSPIIDLPVLSYSSHLYPCMVRTPPAFLKSRLTPPMLCITEAIFPCGGKGSSV